MCLFASFLILFSLVSVALSEPPPLSFPSFFTLSLPPSLKLVSSPVELPSSPSLASCICLSLQLSHSLQLSPSPCRSNFPLSLSIVHSDLIRLLPIIQVRNSNRQQERIASVITKYDPFCT